jgi:hypothetical protein
MRPGGADTVKAKRVAQSDLHGVRALTPPARAGRSPELAINAQHPRIRHEKEAHRYSIDRGFEVASRQTRSVDDERSRFYDKPPHKRRHFNLGRRGIGRSDKNRLHVRIR